MVCFNCLHVIIPIFTFFKIFYFVSLFSYIFCCRYSAVFTTAIMQISTLCNKLNFILSYLLSGFFNPPLTFGSLNIFKIPETFVKHRSFSTIFPPVF